MKKYFNVSFQYSESVYCANIAHAESAEAVEAHYSEKYEWCKVSEATAADVEEAQRKGKPIVEIESPAAEADTVRQDAQKADEARALVQGELEDAREALAEKEAECDDLAQSVENALQHAEEVEEKAQKLAAEVLRLKAQLFDMMEAQQGRTV